MTISKRCAISIDTIFEVALEVLGCVFVGGLLILPRGAARSLRLVPLNQRVDGFVAVALVDETPLTGDCSALRQHTDATLLFDRLVELGEKTLVVGPFLSPHSALCVGDETRLVIRAVLLQ